MKREYVDYLKNFSIGFFTGYLFAVMFTYLLQMAASGFDFGNFDVQVVLMGILFGWIVGIINGAFCMKQMALSRIAAGLLSGIIVFYIIVMQF